jgi:hypothetical protein
MHVISFPVKTSLLAVVLLAAVPCLHAQNWLEKLNNGLEKANRALAGGNNSVPSPQISTGPAMPQPTDAQVAQLVKWANSPAMTNNDIKPMWESAKERIGTVVLFASCSPSGDASEKSLARYTVPNSMYVFLGAPGFPMNFMTYHPKSECLTIDRIDGVNLLARNAFSFRVVYVSDTSGESSIANYKVIRQPDGEWLFARP